jgi:hypothetical protein
MEELIMKTMEENKCGREKAIEIIKEKMGPGFFARTWDAVKNAASAEAAAAGEGVLAGTTGVGTALGLGLGAVGAIWVGQKTGVLPSFAASSAGKVAG